MGGNPQYDGVGMMTVKTTRLPAACLPAACPCRPQDRCPQNLLSQDGGFTLLELVLTVTIMAIIAMMAVPDWSEFEDTAALSSSASLLATARLALIRCAAQGTGAALFTQYSQGGPTLLTVENSDGGGNICWTGHLQNGATPWIGGAPLACTGVTATGLTAITPSCPNPQSGAWSVQYAGLDANVS